MQRVTTKSCEVEAFISTCGARTLVRAPLGDPRWAHLKKVAGIQRFPRVSGRGAAGGVRYVRACEALLIALPALLAVYVV